MVNIKASSQIPLKGDVWVKAIASLSDIFKKRTNYDIYLMSTVIGILYDKQIDELEYTDTVNEPPSVPRVIFNDNSEIFDYLFQSAILTSKNYDFDEDTRLDMAFNYENSDFNRIQMLTKFANYGITKLFDLVGNDSLETMENIKNFLAGTMEGTNWDIDELIIEEI